MYQINPTSNEIVQLVPKSFSELGFTEREAEKIEKIIKVYMLKVN